MADVTITAADVRPLVNSVMRRFPIGEALSVGAAVYLHTDGTVLKADADAAASAQVIGVVVSFPEAGKVTGAIGDWCDVLMFGPLTGFSGLTIGSLVWASVTAGAIADTRPAGSSGDYAFVVGRAISATEVFVNPFSDIFTAL